MAHEIYRDDKRYLAVSEGMLDVNGKAKIRLEGLKIGRVTNPKTIAAIKAQGENPDDRFALPYGPVQFALPNCCRAAVEQAIADESKRNDEACRIASLPHNVERRRIDALYAVADRALNGSYCDPGTGYGLQAQADAALEAWRLQYPDAAREEHRQQLIDEAGVLEHKAVGALTYDADGWLSADEQQRRHDDLMSQAAVKRVEAAKL